MSSFTKTSGTSATMTSTSLASTTTVTSVTETQVSVSVSLTLQVGQPDVFIADAGVISALIRSMAEVTDVPADSIDVSLQRLVDGRRLGGGGGNVQANYIIGIPGNGTSGSSIAQAVAATSVSDMQAIMVSQIPSSFSMNLTEVLDAEIVNSVTNPIRCSPGTWSTDGYPPCFDCLPGFYSMFPGSNVSCSDCPPGTYAGQAGSSICDVCAPGSTSPARASSCEGCELGFSKRLAGSGFCDPCSPGRYTNGSGSSECAPCPPGTYNGNLGGRDEDACLPCGLGQFQSDWGAAICINCGKGNFSESQRQTECHQCGHDGGGPAHSTTENVASNDRTDCVCDSGMYLINRTRELRGPSGSRGALLARVQRPFNGPEPGACAACPAGLECLGGRLGSNSLHRPPVTKRGISAGKPPRENEEPPWVVECENELKCPGGLELGTCPPNREPGPGCDRCMVDFYQNNEGACVPCGTASNTVPLVLMILGVLLLVVGVYVYALTTLSVSSSALRTLTSVISITLTTAQVLGAFNQILIEWPEPLKSLLDAMGALRFTSEFARPGCVFRLNRPEIMYLGSSTGHLCFAAVLTILVYIFRLLRLGPPISFDHLVKCQGMLIMSVYTTLCVSSLLPWQCAQNPDKSSSVATMRGVICWRFSHSVMIGTSIVLVLVYVVGWLSIIAWATIVYPKTIVHSDGAKFATRFHFLFFRYRPEVYWYGLISAIRGLLIAAGPILLVNYMAIQLMYMVFVINGTSMICQRAKPWRIRWINLLDFCFSMCLTLTLVAAALLQETSHTEVLASTSVVFYCILSLMGTSIIAIAAVSCYRLFVPHKLYSAFLCYHRLGNAVLSRWFKMELVNAGAGAVFLDADSTLSPDEKVKIAAFDSEQLVLLLTREILRSHRPASQLAIAVKHGLKIIPITCNDYVRPDPAFFETLEDLWSVDKVVAMRVLGVDIALIRRAYLEIDITPGFELDRRSSIEAHEHVVHQVNEALLKGHRTVGGRIARQDCLERLCHRRRPHLRRMPARACLIDNSEANAAECYGCHILLLCNESVSESMLLCNVLKLWLQNLTQESVAVAKASPQDDQAGLNLKGVLTVIAVIQRGTLEGINFAAQAVAVAEYANEKPLQIIAIVGDPMFEFPDMDYWKQLADGRKLDMSAQVLQHVKLRQVLHAYKSLFSDTSLRLSPEAPKWVQLQQINDVCKRLAQVEDGARTRKDRDTSSAVSQADALASELARSQSENGGISVAFVTSAQFHNLCKEKSGKEAPSFYDLKDPFFQGDAALGKDKVCPRDGRRGCALIDYFLEHRGECTHFMSWTWGYKVTMLADALACWTHRSSLNPEEVFLYCCFFVNNQYRILVEGSGAGSDNLEVVFESRLNKIGRVVAVLDTWDNPRYLTRVWTIFEQFTAVKLGLPVTIVLPSAAGNSLMDELDKGKDGIAKVRETLSQIDSEASEAFMKADEDKVKGFIRETIGFKAVNTAVARNMISWVATVVQDRFFSYLDDDDDDAAAADNNTKGQEDILAEEHSSGSVSVDSELPISGTISPMPIGFRANKNTTGQEDIIEKGTMISV